MSENEETQSIEIQIKVKGLGSIFGALVQAVTDIFPGFVMEQRVQGFNAWAYNQMLEPTVGARDLAKGSEEAQTKANEPNKAEASPKPRLHSVKMADGAVAVACRIEEETTKSGRTTYFFMDGKKKVILTKGKGGEFRERAPAIRDFSKAVLTDEGKRILGVVHEAGATTFKGLMGRANLTQGQLLGQYRTLEGLGLLMKDDHGAIRLTPHGINTVEGTRPSFGVIPVPAEAQPEKDEDLKITSVEFQVQKNDAGQFAPAPPAEVQPEPPEKPKRVRVRDYAKERERRKIREAMKADATGDAVQSEEAREA